MVIGDWACRGKGLSIPLSENDRGEEGVESLLASECDLALSSNCSAPLTSSQCFVPCRRPGRLTLRRSCLFSRLDIEVDWQRLVSVCLLRLWTWVCECELIRPRIHFDFVFLPSSTMNRNDLFPQPAALPVDISMTLRRPIQARHGSLWVCPREFVTVDSAMIRRGNAAINVWNSFARYLQDRAGDDRAAENKVSNRRQLSQDRRRSQPIAQGSEISWVGLLSRR